MNILTVDELRKELEGIDGAVEVWIDDYSHLDTLPCMEAHVVSGCPDDPEPAILLLSPLSENIEQVSFTHVRDETYEHRTTTRKLPPLKFG